MLVEIAILFLIIIVSIFENNFMDYLLNTFKDFCIVFYTKLYRDHSVTSSSYFLLFELMNVSGVGIISFLEQEICSFVCSEEKVI